MIAPLAKRKVETRSDKAARKRQQKKAKQLGSRLDDALLDEKQLASEAGDLERHRAANLPWAGSIIVSAAFGEGGSIRFKVAGAVGCSLELEAYKLAFEVYAAEQNFAL